LTFEYKLAAFHNHWLIEMLKSICFGTL